MAIMFNFQEFAKILLSLNISGRLSGREDGSSFCFNCLIGICLISIVFRSWCFNGHNGVTFFNIICFCCQSYIFLQFAQVAELSGCLGGMEVHCYFDKAQRMLVTSYGSFMCCKTYVISCLFVYLQTNKQKIYVCKCIHKTSRYQ